MTFGHGIFTEDQMGILFRVSKEHAWQRFCVARDAIVSQVTACIPKTTSGSRSFISAGENKVLPPGLLGGVSSPHPSIFVAPLHAIITLPMKACEAPMEIPSLCHQAHLVNRKHINPSITQKKNDAVCLLNNLPQVGEEKTLLNTAANPSMTLQCLSTGGLIHLLHSGKYVSIL